VERLRASCACRRATLALLVVEVVGALAIEDSCAGSAPSVIEKLGLLDLQRFKVINRDTVDQKVQGRKK
jgi:hypothetical protein